MYVYINSQGRVLETITAEQVNQGSDLANRIHFHVEGLTREQNPVVSAQFKLPNGNTYTKTISANVEDPGYVPESDFDYRVFKPDYPYLFWYCDLDSTLLAENGTLQCSLIVQIGGNPVITTVQGMIVIQIKDSAVDDPNLSLSQYEYLLYEIGQQTANMYVLKVGDTMTGPLSTPSISANQMGSNNGLAIDFLNGIHMDDISGTDVTLDGTGLFVDGPASTLAYVQDAEVGVTKGANYIKLHFDAQNRPVITSRNGGSETNAIIMTKAGTHPLGWMSDDVQSIALSYSAASGVLSAEIIKNDLSIISSTVDLPLESAIVGMEYDADTNEMIFTLTSGDQTRVPLGDIFVGMVSLDNTEWARKAQMSLAIAPNELVNLNGKQLTNFTSQPFAMDGYSGIVILTADEEAPLTHDQAKRYMYAMTGSEYVPEWGGDDLITQNSWILIANNGDADLFKPQWDEDNGLLLYQLPMPFVDLASNQTITGVKTFSNEVKFGQYGSKIKEDNGALFLQGASGVIKADSTIRPTSNNSKDLGESNYYWKVAFAKTIRFDDWTYIGQLNSDLYFESITGYLRFNAHLRASSDNAKDLGTSTIKWKDIYLGGKISDGTNSFTPATIANLIRINALAVAEESDIWDLPMTVPSIVGNGAVIDGSKMRLGALYGKCVAWNQMVDPTRTTYTESGVTVTNNGDGSFTINGTASANVNVSFNMNSWEKIQLVAGHKYLMKGNLSSSNPIMLCAGHSDAGAGAIWTNANTESNKSVYATITSGLTVSNIKYRPQIFDLTLIYGAGNEPTTVAQFEADFPEAYYAYDAGSIKGSAVTKIISKGKNLLDNEHNLTVGDYVTTTGQGAESAGSFRCIESIPCKPSTNYYLKAFNFENGDGGRATYMYFWDENGNFINFTANYSKAIALGFTTPSNARRMAMQIYTADRNYRGQVPIDGQFMLVEGSVAPTKYDPYFKEELNIPTAVQGFAQRGIGGVQNELDFANKQAIGRLGEVDLGTLNWTKGSNNRFVSGGISSNALRPSADNVVANILCSKFTTDSASGVYSHDHQQSIAVNSEGVLFIYVDDTYYSNTDAATFKTAMSGVKLVYQLAEESVTDLSSIGDLGDFNPYIKIKVGGTVDCDCEVKPTLDASVAVYE